MYQSVGTSVGVCLLSAGVGHLSADMPCRWLAFFVLVRLHLFVA